MHTAARPTAFCSEGSAPETRPADLQANWANRFRLPVDDGQHDRADSDSMPVKKMVRKRTPQNAPFPTNSDKPYWRK